MYLDPTWRNGDQSLGTALASLRILLSPLMEWWPLLWLCHDLWSSYSHDGGLTYISVIEQLLDMAVHIALLLDCSNRGLLSVNIPPAHQWISPFGLQQRVRLRPLIFEPTRHISNLTAVLGARQTPCHAVSKLYHERFPIAWGSSALWIQVAHIGHSPAVWGTWARVFSWRLWPSRVTISNLHPLRHCQNTRHRYVLDGWNRSLIPSRIF